MTACSTRRAALGAILTAPLAPAPAVAAKQSVSPELARLIAKHDRINAILDEETDTDDLSLPSYGTMRAACVARTRVLGFQSAGMADVLAKAACLGRLWPTEELAVELRLKVKNSEVCMDEMAMGLALDLMRIAEGMLCA